MIAMQLYQLITEKSPDFSTKPFREWASKVEVDSEVLDTINAGLDAYSVFARARVNSIADKGLPLFSLRKNSLTSASVIPS